MKGKLEILQQRSLVGPFLIKGTKLALAEMELLGSNTSS